MRPHPASLARSLIVAGLTAILCACSTTVSQEPIATASIAPRPPEGMQRNAPPASIETGSLGNAATNPTPPHSRSRWSEAPRPTGPIEPAPPVENPQPMRWHATPAPHRAPGPANGRPNGSQVVIVREGDTLYSLSRRYGVPVAELVAANRLGGGRIEIGQRLVVPAGRPALAQRRN